jgi:hypothetical protein
VDYINNPMNVRLAIDKMTTWKLLQETGVPTVEWATDFFVASQWLENGDRVLVRTSLSGSQGRGIEVYSLPHTEWTASGLHMPSITDGAYVKVFGRNPQHVTEYRVHVVGGQVIDFVQKKRSRSYEGRPDPYIRSYSKGWIFARTGVDLPQLVDEASTAAVRSLGLDFGAVDIGADRDGNVCVYEINTAPGIEGTTIGRYADALKNITRCGTED